MYYNHRIINEKDATLKVCKFGGSSLADAKCFACVKKILSSDRARKVVVVSAPGRRFSNDEKITDLLLGAYAKKSVSDKIIALNAAFSRFYGVAKDLDLKIPLDEELKTIYENLREGEDYVVSRGEYLSAKIAAEYFGFVFYDAKDLFFFDGTGAVDYEKTCSAFSKIKKYPVVIPGFYGSDESGKVKLFPRGGSDVSGSLAAAALNADVYENFTDVSGVFPVDPSFGLGLSPIKEIGAKELSRMSARGAKVLSEGALFPLAEKSVALRIKNTFRPKSDGTTVSFNGTRKRGLVGVCSLKSKARYGFTDVSAVFSGAAYDNGERGALALKEKGVCFTRQFVEDGGETLVFSVREKDEAAAVAAVYRAYSTKTAF